MIVLSSDQVVKDLMDKRSNIYSDRPDMYFLQIIGGGNRFLSMPYGDTWRLLRKLCHTPLNINTAKFYVPYQDLESKMLLDGMLQNPQLWIEHIKRYSHSIMTQMLFGFRTTSMDDPKRNALYHVVESMSEVLGSSTGAVLEVYPLARKLPDFMLPEKKHAKKLHEAERSLFVGMWLDAKRAVLGGTSKPCFSRDLVQNQLAYGISEELCGWTVGTLLEAGSDTSANTLMGFIQAMILFPSVQKQAQEELDRVCGDARLPTMEDMDDLPYIHACVKESLRWMPTAILGAPHKVMQDNEYMGYHIPAGASVTCNVWAIHMDEKRHPCPREFDPLRYIHDPKSSYESATSADASQRDHFVFGTGRRLCQGMHVADRTLHLAVSRLLWAFNIDKALDDDGREVVPDPERLTQGFILHPEPFPASITPRSEKHAVLLRKDWEACQQLLDQRKQWIHLPEGLGSKK
ncbi:hypothetical protein N0V93_008429 [Gnomoniopsis smithogilvyi]|uniref:Cytochrome P450 n=1 Tax=Gnomoniopsis smithogilvyi TaxID=1191159 RepID=A0A9W9CTW1_9PEZI|nr:hypothetical protein N0V93_008429 [Gnomoniopsis smithogilvyi]